MRMPAAVAGVVLAAAACGGNGNGDGPAAGRSIEPEAQQRAESIGLKLSDFPNGWRASAPEEDPAAERARFNRCAGIDYSEVTLVGDADSQDFAKESAEASSQVEIYENDQQAEAALSEFSGGLGRGSTEDCFQDLVERAVKEEGTSNEDFKLGEIDIGELSFTPPPEVDEAKAWQVVLPVDVTSGAFKGISADVYLDYFTLREGDTLAIIVTQDVLDEFDRELRDKLVADVAGRMTEPST
jgi:hypothetical protein